MNLEDTVPVARLARHVVFTALALLLPACDPSASFSANTAMYNAAVESGKRDVPVVKEFVTLYPDSKHIISYYMIRGQSPSWSSEVGLYGRYVLTAQMPITLDSSGQRVVGWQPAQFWLRKVSEVRLLSDGRWSISYDRNAEVTFGEVQWRELVSARGDIGTLIREVEKSRPLPDFDHAWGWE